MTATRCHSPGKTDINTSSLLHFFYIFFFLPFSRSFSPSFIPSSLFSFLFFPPPFTPYYISSTFVRLKALHLQHIQLSSGHGRTTFFTNQHTPTYMINPQDQPAQQQQSAQQAAASTDTPTCPGTATAGNHFLTDGATWIISIPPLMPGSPMVSPPRSWWFIVC